MYFFLLMLMIIIYQVNVSSWKNLISWLIGDIIDNRNYFHNFITAIPNNVFNNWNSFMTLLPTIRKMYLTVAVACGTCIGQFDVRSPRELLHQSGWTYFMSVDEFLSCEFISMERDIPRPVLCFYSIFFVVCHISIYLCA